MPCVGIRLSSSRPVAAIAMPITGTTRTPVTIAELVELCRRGPASARVTGIYQGPSAADEIMPGFDERPTL